MRTDAGENAELGGELAGEGQPARPRSSRCTSRRAASPRSRSPAAPFHDPAADAALVDALRVRPRPAHRPARARHRHQRPGLRVARSPRRWTAALDPAREGVRHEHVAPRSSTGCAPRWREGRPIIGGGAGTGLSAKCSEAAGLDFIVVYNSGRYRMAGRSSMAGLMPYGDANAIVMEMGAEILPVVERHPGRGRGLRHRPVPADAAVPASRCRRPGFAGVQNYPTVCLFDGIIRANLEETGLGFDKEADDGRRGARARPVHGDLRRQPRRGRRRWPRPAPTSSCRTWA